MSLLHQNARPAEIKRGCTFADSFKTEADVITNGGESGGTNPVVYSQEGITFDGTNYVKYNVPSLVSSEKGATILGWVRFNSLPASHHRIFRGVAASFYLGHNGSNQLQAGVQDATGAHIAYAKSFSFTIGKWYHIAFRYNTTEMEAWIDGVSVGAASHGLASGVNLAINNSPIYFGCYDGSSEFLDGTIRDWKFFADSLSEDEIQAYADNTMWDYDRNFMVNLR